MKHLAVALLMLTATPATAQQNQQQQPPQPQSSTSIPEAELQRIAAELSKLQVVPPSSSAAAWQWTGPLTIKTTRDNAGVFPGADPKRSPIARVSAGREFKVIDKVDDWYAVAFDDNATGWLQAKDTVPTTNLMMTGYVTDRMQAGIADALIKAAKFRDDMRNNRYMKVKGFSLTITLPPAISVDFEFVEIP